MWRVMFLLAGWQVYYEEDYLHYKRESSVLQSVCAQHMFSTTQQKESPGHHKVSTECVKIYSEYISDLLGLRHGLKEHQIQSRCSLDHPTSPTSQPVRCHAGGQGVVLSSKKQDFIMVSVTAMYVSLTRACTDHLIQAEIYIWLQ